MSDVIELKERIKDLKVLFVDDEEDIRIGTGIFLKKFFNDVTVVNDGKEALDSFNEDIDILIADIKMPKINGIDLAKKLLEIKKDLYIVFITASRGEFKCDPDLFDIYVKKPITYDDIMMIMREIDKAFSKDQ